MVHVIFAYSTCLSNIKGTSGRWGLGDSTWRLGEGSLQYCARMETWGRGLQYFLAGGGDSRGGFDVPEWGI